MANITDNRPMIGQYTYKRAIIGLTKSAFSVICVSGDTPTTVFRFTSAHTIRLDFMLYSYSNTI